MHVRHIPNGRVGRLESKSTIKWSELNGCLHSTNKSLGAEHPLMVRAENPQAPDLTPWSKGPGFECTDPLLDPKCRKKYRKSRHIDRFRAQVQNRYGPLNAKQRRAAYPKRRPSVLLSNRCLSFPLSTSTSKNTEWQSRAALKQLFENQGPIYGTLGNLHSTEHQDRFSPRR